MGIFSWSVRGRGFSDTRGFTGAVESVNASLEYMAANVGFETLHGSKTYNGWVLQRYFLGKIDNVGYVLVNRFGFQLTTFKQRLFVTSS